MYVTQDLPISLDSGQEPGRWATLVVQGILVPMTGFGRTRTIPVTLGPCQIRLGRMVQVRLQHLQRDMKVRGVLYPSNWFHLFEETKL
jgi:hypothetical protein